MGVVLFLLLAIVVFAALVKVSSLVRQGLSRRVIISGEREALADALSDDRQARIDR